jgi:hypothetical protein
MKSLYFHLPLTIESTKKITSYDDWMSGWSEQILNEYPWPIIYTFELVWLHSILAHHLWTWHFGTSWHATFPLCAPKNWWSNSSHVWQRVILLTTNLIKPWYEANALCKLITRGHQSNVMLQSPKLTFIHPVSPFSHFLKIYPVLNGHPRLRFFQVRWVTQDGPRC